MPKHPKQEAERQFTHGSAPGTLQGGSHLDAQARSRVKRRGKKKKNEELITGLGESKKITARISDLAGRGASAAIGRRAASPRLSPESLHAM